ncbi:DUF5018-related domain-containing protein [Aestuariivivens sediminis]|uniref:DUF5018-related domain-containing protein n=1 Tax=Aestuariivivens sediminis TaxID=2913557 RepID=UPI001F595445|nr:hypothetical protein [Aestuariivivens sediminis]
MKNILYKTMLLVLLLTTTSCLKDGLDDLPLFDEANILDFDLEYRFIAKNDTGYDILQNVPLTSGVEAIIDSNNNTVTITPTIPEPSGYFTQEEQDKVTLQYIVGFAEISPAAKITTLNGAPKLGEPGNFSQSVQYRITAADGTTKDWTITVNPF